VEASDIALANHLAHEVLGRSLDELAPQTRRLLQLIDAYVTRECQARQIERSEFRFSQKTIRDVTGWTDFQVKTHIHKLADLEYLLVHRGRGHSFVYELLYDGKGGDGKPFLAGLIDIDALHSYDGKREHPNPEWEHSETQKEQPGSPPGAPREHGGSIGETSTNANNDGPLPLLKPKKPEKAHKGLTRKTPIVRVARRRNGNGRAQA
jgi:hypothetical protein